MSRFFQRLGLLRAAVFLGGVAGFAVGAAFLFAGAGASVANGAGSQKLAHAFADPGALRVIQTPSQVTEELRHAYPRLRALFGTDGHRRAHALPAGTIPQTIEFSLITQFFGAPVRSTSVAASDLSALSVEPIHEGSAGTIWVSTAGGRICENTVQTATNPHTGDQMQGAPGVCETEAEVVQDGLIAESTFSGKSEVWGLVPSGNSSVSIGLGAQGSVTAPVSNGAVFAHVTAPPRGVTFTNANAHTVTVP